MHAAERIGRYYLDHALTVYDLMGQTHPDLDAAREVLDWITKHCDRTGLDSFTRRDALRSLHGRTRFATATDLEPAFDLLTDHGHIRPKTTQKSSRGGRPTSVYEVHPAVLATR
jgi:replicative DNA helicase